MHQRRLDIPTLVCALARALLVWALLVPLGFGGQSPGGGSPARRLTEQDLRATFEHAQQSLAAKDYAGAEHGFKEFLKLDPQSAAGYTNLGVVYLRTGKSEEAIQAFETARKLDPHMVGVDLNLGLAYYRKQDFGHAVPYFEHLLAADPDSVQAHYLLGMSHFMRKEYDPEVTALEPIRNQEQRRSRLPLYARHRLWPTEAQQRFDENLRAIGACRRGYAPPAFASRQSLS